MTDEELAEALDIRACHYDAGGKACLEHGAYGAVGWDCVRRNALLIGARAGIDLAREGIADAITQTVADMGAGRLPIRELAAVRYGEAAAIARGWGT